MERFKLNVVSTDWLHENLDAPDIRVVDATWYMPTERKDARAEHKAAHIPGAVYFDIDEICDTATDLPHMLPSPEKFSSRVRRLGLGDGVRIVIYDSHGIFSSPRVWWMFKAFGHEQVAILDGGLPKWRAEGRPLENLPPMPRERHFTARLNSDLVRGLDQMKDNQDKGLWQVVDARPEARFKGDSPEPRAGLKKGHIPGAMNVPFTSLIHSNGTIKGPMEIKGMFEQAGADFTKPIVTSCGSGVTAAILSLALTDAGHADVSLYDGSWAEWGDEGADNPVEAG